MTEHRAAAVVLLNARGRVLLIHEDYGLRRWGLPGGRIEKDEQPRDAARREVFEETGLDVEIGVLVGEYTVLHSDRPDTHVSVFRAQIIGGIERPNAGEIDDIGWFLPGELPEPMTNSLPFAIDDACAGCVGEQRVIRART